MTNLPVSELLAKLKWEERIDCENLPDDLTPEDLTAKVQSLVADLRRLRMKPDFGEPINCIMHRLAPSKYENPLSDIGSEIRNSRFNYKDSQGAIKNRTLYFGDYPLTCFAEQFQEISVLEDPVFPPPSHSLHSYQVLLSNVLKLDEKHHAERIGVSMEVLLNEWRYLNEQYSLPSASQILGNIIRVSGYKGILYRSTRLSPGRNLVVFTENAHDFSPIKVGTVPFDFEEVKSRITGKTLTTEPALALE